MKLNDAVLGFLFAALGAAILFFIQSFPKIPGQPVGPALFPGLIAAGLVATGLALVVRGWRQRAVQPWFAWEDWVRSPRHRTALAVLVASAVFYVLVSDRLGFLPTALIVLVAVMAALRVPVRRIVPIAVVAVLLVHYAFYKLLRVPLPWGVLTPWSW